MDLDNIIELTQQLKRNMLSTIKSAGTGHLGACCSSAELMGTLYFSDILKIDSDDPKHPDRDHVLVRGHLGPLRYNLFSMFGWMESEEMLHYREFGSRLCGHEDMCVTPGVDITPSGSLGMLLSYAVGARYSFRHQGKENRVFCFLGDGEEQEGNVSEAARHAGHLKLESIIAIIDKNGKQLSTSVKYTDSADLAKIWEGYGWTVLEVDGHSVPDVYETYKQATEVAKSGPVCIIAHTIKGNGVPGALEHYSGYHVLHEGEGKNTESAAPLDVAIGAIEKKNVVVPKKNIPFNKHWYNSTTFKRIEPKYIDAKETSYDYLTEFLTGLALQKNRPNIHVLTADYPPRPLIYGVGKFSIPDIDYCNVGIREQHLLSMAHGMRTVDKDSLLLVLCGDAFAYRFADQLNVLAQSNDNIIVYAVQAGLSGAKNGSTHQSSGQPGIMLTMPGMQFYEPSSKRDWFAVMNRAVQEPGVKFIRTHKNFTPHDFGGFKDAPLYEIPISEGIPQCTIASNGMTMHEVVKAARMLADDGICSKVFNIVDPKRMSTIDVAPDKPLFTVYNGNPEVLSYPISRALFNGRCRPSCIVEAGFEIGKTGSVGDLMKYFRLDSESIYEEVHEYLGA